MEPWILVSATRREPRKMPGELKEIFTAESIERMAADLEESGRTHCDPGLTYLAQRLRKLKEQI